jgi:predicted AAA+ superfamily ATPase
MDSLLERSYQRLKNTPTRFIRSLMDEINWDTRLIGIKGARGVGKTTLLLQYMKCRLKPNFPALYVSLDNIYFAEHKLYHLADTYVKQGGKLLLLDEVHKYPNWSQEIKNIYDDFAELKVVFTGSSLLEILNARADLSRRAVIYEMQGFSFREYLNKNTGSTFNPVTLKQILESHNELSSRFTAQIKVFEHFNSYLQTGYYPFYDDVKQNYYQQINEIVSLVLEIELPLLRGVEVAFVPKVKQLLQIMAESVPFVPNITKLSERIGITRNSLLAYIHALHESNLTLNVHKNAFGISKLQKPDKIYLENTNLMYALSHEAVNKGHLRETFFANQLKKTHQLQYAPKGDFIVDGAFTFEIGGKDKNTTQIKDLPAAFIVADDIEYGFGNKIPLWLFGFLY